MSNRSIIESAIAWAWATAESTAHGYDQSSRWGADYDCSSYVITAYRVGGLTLAGASYTGNMLSTFLGDGFQIVTDGTLVRGDVLLNVQNHTALYVGDGKLLQASINELGGITGGQTGDQLSNTVYGGEIGLFNYYNYPWDYVLRLPNDGSQDKFTIHAKPTGGYPLGSQEAIDNCNAIGWMLQKYGYSLASICGILGNIGGESAYNPWRWQSDIILATYSESITLQSGHAYGLFQFDPAGNYINNTTAQGLDGYAPNFSNQIGNKSDLFAQVGLVMTGFNYYPSSTYPITFNAYKTITDVETATKAWFYNFERGTWSDQRLTNAQFWYQYFSHNPFHRNMPKWLLFKLKEANSNAI